MSFPAAVIFDNDGLTLDSEELWTQAEQKLFASYEIEFSDAHKIALLGNSGPTRRRFWPASWADLVRRARRSSTR